MARSLQLPLCVLIVFAAVAAQDGRQEVVKGTGVNPFDSSNRRWPGADRFRGHGHHGHHGHHHEGHPHHEGHHEGHPHEHHGGHHGHHHDDSWMRNLLANIPKANNGAIDPTMARHHELMQRMHAAMNGRQGSLTRHGQTGVSQLGQMPYVADEQFQPRRAGSLSHSTAHGPMRSARRGGHHSNHHRGHHHGHHGVHDMNVGGVPTRAHRVTHHRRGYRMGPHFQPAA